MGVMRNILIKITLLYLRTAAKIQLAKINPKHIVGITGSAGKSSCREAVYTVLKTKYKVKQSSTGNSESGLPLDILGFDHDPNYSIAYWLAVVLLIPIKILFNWDKYDVYVAEMGVDSPTEPKNMSYLLKIIRPDIGVFLNVLPVHTEYFPQKSADDLISAIAEEKGKLITNLPKNGWAVVNLDDKKVSEFKNKTQSKIITFGATKSADIQTFIPKSESYAYTEDYGYTFAATIAVGKVLDVDIEIAKDALTKNFRLPAGRGVIFSGINSSILIDSSYNANRQTVISSLELLKTYPGKRKIAVLGDMRELGDLAKQEHEAVARDALKTADHIFTFGPLMEKFFQPKTEKVETFTNMSKLVKSVQDFIKPGDVVLVKGSQNTILLETLVEALLGNKHESEKLCRRGEFWNNKRQELL